MQVLEKRLARSKRHLRIRKKIFGSNERPRLSVHRSVKHFFIQLVDDVNQKTLFSFSTLDKDFRKSIKQTGNIEAAKKLGEYFGPQILKKGIKKITFDRGGYVFHGRVKALADSLRKAGLEF